MLPPAAAVMLLIKSYYKERRVVNFIHSLDSCRLTRLVQPASLEVLSSYYGKSLYGLSNSWHLSSLPYLLADEFVT